MGLRTPVDSLALGIDPGHAGDHVNLMLDICTLALQTDTTRVGTFMFSYEKSGRSYPQIDAPGSHHSTSHHQGNPKNHDELTNINTHHMELFARMLGRMAAIEEGDSTLLDNVALLYGSGISDGNKHNHDDLPIRDAVAAARANNHRFSSLVTVIVRSFSFRYRMDPPF